MAERHQYKSYTVATQNTAKLQQILCVYDVVIRNLQVARNAIREKRIEERYKTLAKTSEIILSLQSAIDFENGGMIARLLYEFYSSVNRRITTIQQTENIAICDEVISEVAKMRNAWYLSDHLDEKQENSLQPTPAIAAKAIATASIPEISGYPSSVTLSA